MGPILKRQMAKATATLSVIKPLSGGEPIAAFRFAISGFQLQTFRTRALII